MFAIDDPYRTLHNGISIPIVMLHGQKQTPDAGELQEETFECVRGGHGDALPEHIPVQTVM